MDARRYVSWLVCGPLVAVGLGVGPGPASAHDVAGSRFVTPIPLSLLFGGAGVTVAVTALWLAVSTPTTPRDRRKPVLAISPSLAASLRHGGQGLFLAGVGAALALGLAGRQVPAANFATVFTWPVWFRGVALVALVAGSPWNLLSPWRRLYRGLCRLEGRQIAVLGPYPSILGEWPAVLGFVVLVGVVENLTVIPRSPRLTAVVLAVYVLAMLGGATLFGPRWLDCADPLGVFYRLFGRVASISVSDTDDGGYALAIRPPWSGCLTPVRSVSLVVFVIATIYTVSFDGFTETRQFQVVLFGVRDALGTGPGTSVLLYLVGLFGFVSSFGIGIWFVERLGAPADRDWVRGARWFAPTVLPIAGAYEVAHNYPYVLRNLGQLFVVSVRWFRPGTGEVQLLGWLSLPVFWGSQVGLVVLGHVVAVVAAHYAALARYESASAARRGHAPLVVLMVGFTVLSLWIISQPVVGG